MYAEKLPPHDIEAEEAVLGSILIDGDSFLRITQQLKPDDFYSGKNKYCFEACTALFERDEALNQITITHELSLKERLDEVGGPAYLSHLIASVPTSVHIEHYAEIVSRTSTMRRLIMAASDIANIGYGGSADTESALSQSEDVLFKVRSRRSARDFVPLRDILDEYLEEQASETDAKKSSAPLSTGYDDLDQLLGGLQRSDLIVLAARPSLGKSTLAVNFSLNISKTGGSVAIFSLEMSREQLAVRILSSEVGVDAHRLRLGLYTDAEEQRIIDSIGSLSELPIYVDDTPFQTIMEMRSKARRLHLERGIDMIVVDYMQLISGSASRNENRVQEISEISRSLKGLARDLNVPVLSVSQLSRAVELRSTHRPILSDLRESGSIEQDADVVMFIYRDDFYYTEDEWDRLQASSVEPKSYPKNIAELIIEKHRHGPTGVIKMVFRERHARFEAVPVVSEAL